MTRHPGVVAGSELLPVLGVKLEHAAGVAASCLYVGLVVVLQMPSQGARVTVTLVASLVGAFKWLLAAMSHHVAVSGKDTQAEKLRSRHLALSLTKAWWVGGWGGWGWMRCG